MSARQESSPSGNPFAWVKCGHPSMPTGPEECVTCLKLQNAEMLSAFEYIKGRLTLGGAQEKACEMLRKYAVNRKCATCQRPSLLPMNEDGTCRHCSGDATNQVPVVESRFCGKYLVGSTEYLPLRCEREIGHDGDCGEKRKGD